MGSKNVGDRVGPYQLVEVLGEGGAGLVFKAIWDPSDEVRQASPDHPAEVALKLLRPTVASNEAIFQRFVREIGVAQQIHHPHILQHFDSGIVDDELYYAMEVASLGSLREVIQRRQRLGWRDATEAAMHVADALAALHDRGVIHRDLKPENVFLAADGALKLGDFGLVRRDDETALTVSGQTVGSVRYMAPEQVRGRNDLDGRCDLYALGCLLFEMLTGRPPFQSTDAMVVFQQHVEEPPQRLRMLAPDAPAALERFIDLLLEKDKHARPPNAQAVRDTLAAFGSSEDGEIAMIDESLNGVAAVIEPQPDDDEEEEDDTLTGSSSLSRSAWDMDDEQDDDDWSPPSSDAPESAVPGGLAQRLAGGAAPSKQGCLPLICLLAVGVSLAAFAF